MSNKPITPPRLSRDRFAQRLAQRRRGLSPSALRVVDYLDQHRHAVLTQSALDIALATETSDATVIRTIQSLGFSGLKDLKDTFQVFLGMTASPSGKMATTVGEHLPQDGEAADAAIDFVVADMTNAMVALSTPENRQGLREIIALLSQAKRIGVFGIGASGIIAAYAARLFTRSGYRAYALNATGIALAEQLLDLAEGDALLVMGHGRKHREAQATLNEAERLGIPVATLATQKGSVLTKQAACCMVLPRSKSDHVALHAPLLYCVETIMLGLASTDPQRSVASLDRLVEIRDTIRPAK